MVALVLSKDPDCTGVPPPRTRQFHRGSSPATLISACAIFGPDTPQGADTKPVMPAVFGLARLFPLVSTLALALLLACSPEAPTEKLRSGRTDPNPATTRHQARGLSPRGHEQGQHAADRTGNGREALIDLFNATDGESRGHDDKRLSSAQWENGTVHGTRGRKCG